MKFHLRMLSAAFIVLSLAFLPLQTRAGSFAEVQRAAMQGDAQAQYDLGECYRGGYGVQRDVGQAVEWYRRAANQNHAEAENALGWHYAHGEGTGKDLAQALALYRKAASHGSVRAQSNLGYMYHKGEGVKKDLAQAKFWYQKAASQGNEVARDNLGDLLVEQERVAQLPTYTMASISSSKAINSLVSVDSQGWTFNSYDQNSIRNVKNLESSKDGKSGVVYGEYTFNDGVAGWLKLRLEAGHVECIEFSDNEGNCRPIRQSPLPIQNGAQRGVAGNDPKSTREEQELFERRASENMYRPEPPREAPPVTPIGGNSGLYGCPSPPCM